MSREDGSKKPEEGKQQRESQFPHRLVGILLLVAAVFLYVHDLRAGSRRAQGANAVRYVSGAAVLGMGLRATPADGSRDQRLYEPCSAEVASNILSRLAVAEPVKMPSLGADAKAYDMFLFLTNRARVFLRVHRAPGSDEAFVSLLEPRRSSGFGADSESWTFVESTPALVLGLGGVLDEIDSGSLESLRGARPVIPEGVTAFTNLVRRAGVAGLTEESFASAAAQLRAIAGSGEVVSAVAASGSMAGGSIRDLRRVASEDVARLVEALKSSVETNSPSGSIEGEEYSVLLLLSSGHAVNLRVAVAEADPDDALVGFVDVAARPGGEGGAPALSVTAPAHVPGFGKILSECAAAKGE